jgi:predicted nucleic acid-binding protein
MRPTVVADKCFFDSNILLYLIEDDEPRTSIAKKLIDIGGTISVQVLNEFANVAVKKAQFTPQQILDSLAPVRDACEVMALDVETHDLAIEIMSKTNLGVYDANIVAAAELAGCDVLYTEDLSHGQVIGRVTVCNPFMAP